MENKQTAVDFIKKELERLGLLDKGEVMTNIFKQAKQMHKEQIMEGYMKAKLEHIDILGLDVVKNKIINDTEKYYKETYGK